MKRPYFLLDVFTDTPLEGNPLAVVTEAEGLDDARMQAIAREFNLSETVFVLPPRDPVNTARLRIFTPASELPFAGHPTVGTAVLLAQRRAPEIIATQDLAVVLEEAVGPVSCIVRRVRGVTRASFALPRLPVLEDGAPGKAAVAEALGLAADEIGPGDAEPTLATAGVPFVMVPVRDRDAAGRAWPDLSRWDAVFGHHGAFLYTRDTRAAGVQVHARMFAPQHGITEDPATGSAVAAFAGVLARDGSLGDGDHTVVVAQGVEMERPSRITLGLVIEGGRLVSGSVGGPAVVMAEGLLDL